MAKIKLNGVSDDTLTAMEKPYEPSDDVKALGIEAANTYDALKSAGGANYAKADQALNAWKNYGDFSYNPDTDILFQNAKANAIANGKVAMQDTIGQASALTGGYANSYAASAGNQAYQNYLKSLDDDLANYYQIALEQYERGKNDLLTEYSLENERGQQEWNKAYSLYGAANDRYTGERSFDYGKYSDEVSHATTLAGMENADWWNKTNFDNENDHWQKDYELEVKKLDADIAHNNATLALSQDELDYRKNNPTASATTGKNTSYDLSKRFDTWAKYINGAVGDDAKTEAAKKTVASEAATLFLNGDIDPSQLLTVAEQFIGIDDLYDYDKLKEYFGKATADELLKQKE